MLLCLPLFDDAAVRKCCRSVCCGGCRYAPRQAATPACRLIVGAVALLLVFCSLVQMDARFGGSPPAVARSVDRLIEPLHIVSAYGLFAVMTTQRDEIVIEGSEDGIDWREYEFRYKPGDVARRPPWNIPHQPRLDWQMWFAALEDPRRLPWFPAVPVAPAGERAGSDRAAGEQSLSGQAACVCARAILRLHVCQPRGQGQGPVVAAAARWAVFSGGASEERRGQAPGALTRGSTRAVSGRYNRVRTSQEPTVLSRRRSQAVARARLLGSCRARRGAGPRRLRCAHLAPADAAAPGGRPVARARGFRARRPRGRRVSPPRPRAVPRAAAAARGRGVAAADRRADPGARSSQSEARRAAQRTAGTTQSDQCDGGGRRTRSRRARRSTSRATSSPIRPMRRSCCARSIPRRNCASRWCGSGSTISACIQYKGDLRWLVADYEEHAIRPHALGSFPRSGARDARASRDAAVSRQQRRMPSGTSTRTMRASSWSCIPSASTAATRNRTCSSSRACSPASASMPAPPPHLQARMAGAVRAPRRVRVQSRRAMTSRRRCCSALASRATGFAEVEQAVTLIVQQPACARFISRQLATYFVARRRRRRAWSSAWRRLSAHRRRHRGGAAHHVPVRRIRRRARRQIQGSDALRGLGGALRLRRPRDHQHAAAAQLAATRSARLPFGRQTPDGYPLTEPQLGESRTDEPPLRDRARDRHAATRTCSMPRMAARPSRHRLSAALEPSVLRSRSSRSSPPSTRAALDAGALPAGMEHVSAGLSGVQL